MGAFRYCHKCETPIDEPTIEEDLQEGGQTCPECGKSLGNLYSLGEWLAAMYNDIKELGDRIGRLDKDKDKEAEEEEHF